ncbi:hypothetical protein K438DRAFT_2028599 [Mycena galopus ATCC 62051]|nr:hypothetical protein K438DRAFT_2028599 [Mycena galopus ATCC 62051]
MPASLVPALPRRTLRSGKEFSAFDLALAIDFDTTACLKWRLSDQQSTGLSHEPEDNVSIPDLTALPFVPDIELPDAPLPVVSPAPPAPSSRSLSLSLSAKDRNKRKSRIRRDRKRNDAQQASVRPTKKAVHSKRMSESRGNYLEVYYDANGLPHSVPAWIGSCGVEGLEFMFPDGSPASGIDRGMGGKHYSQAEVDALTGTQGFLYISWLGLLTIAILDSRRRVIGLLGGVPQGAEDWAEVTERASKRMHERLGRLSLSPEKLDHRRAQEPYAPVSRGVSHGGGQMEPGNLQQNDTNTIVTDELLADPDIM